MSINLSPELQAKLEQLASSKGWSVDEVVEKAVLAFVEEEVTELPLKANDLTERELENEKGLNWQTASAEEIIASLKASRVERENDLIL